MNRDMASLILCAVLATSACGALPVTDGLIVKLRADSLTELQDGDLVAEWIDTAQDDPVDGTVVDVGRSLPQYKADALNSKPVVRFNGAEALVSGGFGIDASAGITMVTVCAGDRGTGDMAERIGQIGPVDAQGGTCIGADVCTNSTNGSGFRMNNGAILINDPNPVTRGWHVAAWLAPQGGRYDQDLAFYVDGAKQPVVANNSNALGLVDTGNVVSVGNGYAGAGQWQWGDFVTADLAVMLVYNRVLTEDEVVTLTGYLQAEYLTLPPMPVTDSLIVELRAESLKQEGLQDGDPVAAWIDTAQDDLADGTVVDVGSNMPEFKVSALNDSKPVVRFNDAEALSSAQFAIDPDAGATLVAVCTGDKTGATAERIAGFGAWNAPGGVSIGADICANPTEVQGSGFRLNNGYALVGNPNPMTTGWHVGVWPVHQGTRQGDLFFYVDGVRYDSLTANNPDNTVIFPETGNVVTVGNGTKANGLWQADDFVTADLAVLLVYDRVLTEDEVLTLTAHLYEAYIAHENAVNPEPADGTSVNSSSTTLSWQPGVSATSHLVYLGTNEQEVVEGAEAALVGTPTEPTLAIEGLLPGTYYWRVDEVTDEAVVTPGTVWSFLVVDPENILNLLANGTFESGTYDPWVVWTGVEVQVVSELAGAAIPDVPAEGSSCLYLSVPTIGGNPWDRWIKHTGLVFEGGKKYTFSAFMKSSQDPFRMRMKPEYRAEAFGSIEVEVTEEWQELSVTTPVFSTTLEGADVALLIGYAVGDIWIDNARFYEGDYVPPTPVTQARNPSPADGTADVTFNPTLSWQPSELAVSHDVYLGLDSDAVSSSDASVLAAQGLEESTLSPGKLALGQTYCWRVDSVAGSPAAVYEGAVWSFSVEPVSRPVTGILATASSSLDPDYYGPQKTVDGSGLTGDLHSTLDTDMWMSDAGLPVWIQYEFTRPEVLDQMWIWNSNLGLEPWFKFGARDVTVETSLDGAAWTEVGGVGTIAQAPGLPGYARDPRLADGATVDSLDVVLEWLTGREAETHTVLISQDVDAILDGSAVIDTTPAARLDLAGLGMALDLGTTYYWQVVEVGAVVPHVGGVAVAAVADGLAAAEGPVLLEPEGAARVHIEVGARLAAAEGGGLGEPLQQRPDSLLVEPVYYGAVRGVLFLVELGARLVHDVVNDGADQGGARVLPCEGALV